MGRLIRLDAELVRRQLARSRTQASELIAAGQVKVDGQIVLKAARQVDRSQAILIQENDATQYVSRGAFKLLGALEYLGKQAPQINGRRCLDAGASTGGFTEVLLQRGAQHVLAVDVGYGQLAWKLQSDPRVTQMDRTNVRHLKAADLPYAPELIVGDMSFISLTLVLPALHACLAPGGKMLLMVKPQFEVGKEMLGAGGVVRDPKLHESAVMRVVLCALDLGLVTRAAAPSSLPGPAGNREYFILLERSSSENLLESVPTMETLVAQAVADRPRQTGGENA